MMAPFAGSLAAENIEAAGGKVSLAKLREVSARVDSP
jgi:hypothetical protein